MKQERSIDELLEVMLDNTAEFEDGLCKWRYNLRNKISDEEHIRLHRYIEKNRPWFCFGTHYWPKGKLEPRLKWIRKHIKKLRRKKPWYYPPL
jgi:hypothetical protein